MTLPVAAIRCAYRIPQAIVACKPSRRWLLETANFPSSDMPDDLLVNFTVPRHRFPLFVNFFFLGRNFMHLPAANQLIVSSHLAKSIPKADPKMDMTDAFSASYEAIVYSKLVLAGFQPEFVPRERGKRTPDIRIPEERILIECKDSHSDAAASKGDAATIRKIQEMIEDADSQLRQFDPEGECVHIIFMDLPEGSRSMLLDRGAADQEVFMRLVFRQGRILVPGAKPPFPWPNRVIFSTYEMCSFGERLEGYLDIEPRWIPPVFVAEGEPQKFKSFFQQFFDGFRSDIGGDSYTR